MVVNHTIAQLVAPLFVPMSRPDRLAKASVSGADAVIADLEDGVATDRKDAARESLRGLVPQLPLIVRINGAGTRWHEQDCASLAGLPIAAIMLPKAEGAGDLARLSAIAPVIALIESAKGLAEARALAQSGLVARLAFGSVDYASDLGCDHSTEALLAARSELVLASRLGGLPAPMDGVTTNLDSPSAVLLDARAARGLGFGGKMSIHPNQVAFVIEAFRPSAAEIDWAERVLDSADGAVRVDGMMVDEPVRLRARTILAKVHDGQG
jgi:citrate lyase subunit beta/citryl-CoA lyase